ncbi:jg20361 [Pararge aegeria aegeria]|uniref:Jg20361 protein n=1 Tax=Pararge aegeria aegeria TaxID=348720 RepID=A0A8S4RCD0_9NEOP|nr:jg20361 [Pararge aegeria aegeria]
MQNHLKNVFLREKYDVYGLSAGFTWGNPHGYHRATGRHGDYIGLVPTKTPRCTYQSPGSWATGPLSHTSATLPFLWDILKCLYNRRRRTENTRCDFQPEDLTPTGDGFPASIAQRSSSRGQAAFMSMTPAPGSPSTYRLRFHVVLSQPLRRLLLCHYWLT